MIPSEKITKCLIIPFVLLLCTSCYIKEDKFKIDQDAENNLVISKDLSNSRIQCIAQDSNGYIWIGTFRGLNRYDGHQYHQYFCTTDSLGLPDNDIEDILCDSRHRLWVATVNGICIYNKEDKFDRIPVLTKDRFIQKIKEDKQGHIFAFNGTEVLLYNSRKNCFEKKFNVPMQIGVGFWPSFNIDHTSHIYISQLNAMLKYNSNTLRLEQRINLNNPRPYYYSQYLQNGIIVLSGYGSFALYNTKTNHYISLSPDNLQKIIRTNNIVQACQLVNGNQILLYTNHNGMFLFSMKDKSLKGQDDTGFPYTVPDAMITQIFQDSKNNIWLGTYGKGCTVEYAYKEKFNNDNYLNRVLDNPFILALSPDKQGNLWFSTLKKGLYVYNFSNRRLKNITLANLPAGEKENDVNHIFIDHQGFIWLATGSLVLKCQYTGERIHILQRYPIFGASDMQEDSNGKIWIATFSTDIYSISARSNVPIKTQIINANFDFISSVLKEHNGNLLFSAFNQNLIQLNPYTGKKIALNIPDMRKCIRRSVFIPTDVKQDNKGIIWIGTVANGLLRYDPKTNTMQHIGGLSCSDISSIQEDKENNLWISTMHGLNEYNKKSGKITTFYKEDGLSGNEFQDRTSCQLPNGTIVFGGTDGLTIFNPANININHHAKLLLEDLTIHNQLVHPGKGQPIEATLDSCKEINLSHDQNSFSISFAALDYGEYQRTHYFYKMEGFDKDWIDAGNNALANYANLPTGHYTFKVCITQNNNAIQESSSIEVYIHPAPLNSWWAWLLYTFLMIIIAYFVYRNSKRVVIARRAARQAEIDKQQEQRTNKMNMSFFANIAHEFRNPLTMIAGPVSQLTDKTYLKEQDQQLLYIVQRSIRRMFRLVNQLMDFNKLENDTLKLKVENVDVIKILNDICDPFEFNVKQKNITLSRIGMNGTLMAWTDRDKLEKIVTNLLSNAIKFTPSEGVITIAVDLIQKEEAQKEIKTLITSHDTFYVKITVTDTGKGIPENQLDNIFRRYYQLDNQTKAIINWGSGIGLYFANSLAKLHHGYLKASNRTNMQGAIFTYIYPINAVSYTEEERKPIKGEETFIRPIKRHIAMSKIKKEDTNKKDDRPTILVVDDDTEVINYMRVLLSADYNVRTCLDANTALQQMRMKEPNIVLSDVIMPNKNGYEFCKEIKQDIQLSHIPVILVTAKVTLDNQVEGLNVGADAYVTKPFDQKVLLALIRSQLKNRERVRNILSQSTTTNEEIAKALSKQDKKFMDELYEVMEAELANSEFNVNKVTETLHISRTKLYYKIKGLTGQNPSDFFRNYKLNRALQLLKEGNNTISEITDITGFSTLSHFSFVFKKRFGISPSQYKR